MFNISHAKSANQEQFSSVTEPSRSTWDSAKVADLFYVKGRIGWRGLRRSDFTSEGPYLITGMHISAGRVRWDDCFHIPQSKFNESPEIIVQKGDILITKDGTIGKIAFIDALPGPASLNSHLFLVRPKTNSVDRKFAYHLFSSFLFEKFIDEQSSGSTLTGLPENRFLNFRFPRPPSHEQLGIAAVLDTLDEVIANTESVIAKLKQVRAGLLHDLLTRGLDENGQFRDPIAHPEQFQDSPLGRIPKEWLCRTLQEAAECFSGGTPDRSQPSLWQGNVPLLTPKDMKVFELSDTSEHVLDSAVQFSSKLMPEGTVFIVVRGMILAHTFPVCLSTRPFGFNQDIKAVRGRAGLTNHFLGHWFGANSPLFLRKATEATHGTKKLDLDELHRVYIGIPSLVEQQAIVDQVELMDSNIKFTTAENIKLDQLKSGLMHDLLTGRVRVREGIAVTG